MKTPPLRDTEKPLKQGEKRVVTPQRYNYVPAINKEEPRLPIDPSTPNPGRRISAAEALRRDLYCSTVWREALRILKTKRRLEADDIAAEVAAKFLADPAKFMAKFPTPEVFAWAVTKNTRLDYERRQRVQRGEGAEGERTVGYLGDHDHVGTEEANGTRFSTNPADEAVSAARVAEIFECIPDAVDRELAWRVLVDGDRITEIAQDWGVHHSTVSRQFKKAKAILEDHVVEGDYVRAA